MRRVCLILSLSLLAFGVAVPAGAQDGVHVAAGVNVAGVDLSGLTVDEARVKLDQQLAPVLAGSVVVQAGAKQFSISPRKAKFAFDSAGTAAQALSAAPGVTVTPLTRVSKIAVDIWVRRVAKSVYVKPREAKLTIGLKRLRVTKAKFGVRISKAAVASQVAAAFTVPLAPRLVTARLLNAYPVTTDNELKREFATVITVSQHEFKLRLFKRFKLVKTYGVAVGQPAYPTPKGRFKIRNKAVNPVWTVPNSPWAGELQGTTVDGGSAANPLKARWMGIVNGVGIHGTGEEYSIGSRASHGCIRMRVKDVIALYPRVPVGTTIVIK